MRYTKRERGTHMNENIEDKRIKLIESYKKFVTNRHDYYNKKLSTGKTLYKMLVDISDSNVTYGYFTARAY